MTIRDDYKVAYCSEETLARMALRLRKKGGVQNALTFNVIRFLMGPFRSENRREFQVAFFDADSEDTPAYVTFNPLKLSISEDTWDLADAGEPRKRFVVAHEICHLYLHDHHGKRFSDDPRAILRWVQPEYSSEWQANTFAAHLLLPDHIVSRFDDPNELARLCDVPLSIATTRFQAVHHAMTSPVRRASGFCPECGNFSVGHDGKCSNDSCRER
jgi:hypothetical protein